MPPGDRRQRSNGSVRQVKNVRIWLYGSQGEGVETVARKRKAGDGTVRQRKDGRWEGRIVIGYDDNGYPTTKNVLAKTKKECVEKLQKLKEECGGLKPEKVRPEMPFGDWLTYW